jgi:hypothetical protein
VTKRILDLAGFICHLWLMPQVPISAFIISLFSLVLILPVQAQTGVDVPRTVVDREISDFILSDAAWSSNSLPGSWADVSVNAGLQSKELRSIGRVFGHQPQQVLAFWENGQINRMEIIFLEAGYFFGFRKSSELTYTETSGGTLESRKFEREIEQLRKSEDAEIKQKQVEFKKLFAALEKELPAKIEAFTKAPGKRTTIGSGSLLRSRVTEFTTPVLAIRYSAEDDQLVSLTVLFKENASRRMIGSTSSRRGAVKDNVKTLPNGDVIIENIPMFNQGSRGYCAIGTLAMITQYYGLNVNIDQLAAKAGYKEGDTDNAIIIPIYQAAAKEAKLKMSQNERFDFRSAMRSLSDGKPILVWRFFSRERDALHSEFKAKYQADPTQLLPDPKKNRDEKNAWPVFANGGHASVVTGFNKERNEVLFTESWGEETRHRRMRAEEMESTCYVLFQFEP